MTQIIDGIPYFDKPSKKHPRRSAHAQKFAVYLDAAIEPESWRAWTAYTYIVNESWPGFRGWYEGHGNTRAKRKSDAIKKARAAHAAPSSNPPAPDDAARVRDAFTVAALEAERAHIVAEEVATDRDFDPRAWDESLVRTARAKADRRKAYLAYRNLPLASETKAEFGAARCCNTEIPRAIAEVGGSTSNASEKAGGADEKGAGS